MSGDRYYIKDQQAVYYLTFTVIDWLDIFTRKSYKYIVTDSLNYCIEKKGLVIYAWVIMSNHLHLIGKAKEGYNLSEIIRDFKKFTAKKILQQIKTMPESRRDWLLDKFELAGKRLQRISKYKFWKDDNHAIELIDNKMIDQKLNYIHENPVRSIIVSESFHYLFSSAVDYSGNKGYVRTSKIL